jgi:hypothetical protein
MAADGVTLDLADQRLPVSDPRAVHLEVDDDVGPLGALDHVLEVLEPHHEGDGLLAASVVDGGNPARLAELPGDALADCGPALALQCLHGHGSSTSVR